MADPQKYADQFANTAWTLGQNSQAQGQNALMMMFQEEAARQRPYATMPAELAMNNIKLQQAAALAPPPAPRTDPFALAEFNHKLQMREIGLRHENALAQGQQRIDAGIYADGDNAAPSSDKQDGIDPASLRNENGQWFITTYVGGNAYPKKLSEEEAAAMGAQ